MTPRPFYRWKSFWLGLCVLVFLGWAWRDSLSRRASAYLALSGSSIECERFGGITLIAFPGLARRNSPYVHLQPVAESVPFRWMGDRENAWARSRMLYLRRTEKGKHHHSCIVPDLVIVASFMGLWFTWLVLHWKQELKKSS